LGYAGRRNLILAAQWYRRAAEGGYSFAQEELWLCYEEAKGVTQDKTEALKWFILSARNGSQSAQRHRDALTNELSQAEVLKAEERAYNFAARTALRSK